MKLTFPHMGNAYVAVKVLLDELKIDYCMPRYANRAAFEKGIAVSPEFMCLPFKAVIGNLIEGLDGGADTILFGGGCGQCRLSYYGDLMQEILRSMGYRFRYIHLDLSNLSYDEVRRKLGPLLTGRKRVLVAKAVTRSARTVFAVDALYARAARLRCREAEKGSVDAVMKRFEKRVQNERGYALTRAAIAQARQGLKAVRTDKSVKPLKIAVVGEIFIASEPFTNLDLERRLGSLGAEVVNTMGVGAWIREHFLHVVLPVRRKNKAVEAAQAYVKTNDFGGHGIYTVGNAELFSRGGYDGIIQIYPFTCMPEIIAQSAFGQIQQKYGVPIMTLIVDELTGEAGYMTRLEAFCDMLQQRREKAERQAGTGGALRTKPS